MPKTQQNYPGCHRAAILLSSVAFDHFLTSCLDSFLGVGPNPKGWMWQSALSLKGYRTGRMWPGVNMRKPQWWAKSPEQRNQCTPGRGLGTLSLPLQQGLEPAHRSTREQPRTPKAVLCVRTQVSPEFCRTQRRSLYLGFGQVQESLPGVSKGHKEGARRIQPKKKRVCHGTEL